MLHPIHDHAAAVATAWDGPHDAYMAAYRALDRAIETTPTPELVVALTTGPILLRAIIRRAAARLSIAA